VSELSAELLVDDLRRAGLRVTAARRAVCRALARHHDEHLTVAELHRLAEQESAGRIDLSTIYRTVEALETAGRLHHVHLGHGPSVLHLSAHSEHHHLVCEVCGRTTDLPVAELDELSARLAERYGFVVDGLHFALIGRCLSHGGTAGGADPAV